MMTEMGSTPGKILAVDDNAYTLRILRHTLQGAGFSVATAVSGEEALQQITTTGLPHLAIVDLHMPGGISGFEFCRSVHQYSDLPIIMLTAVDDENTVLEGLEKHAEDYIVKPFSPGELTARVNRLLQRMGQFAYPLAQEIVVDDRLRINFPQRVAIVEEESVSLTPTETKLLYLLMHSAGQTVTTEYILRRLWPGETAFEDRLHVHLHRLRRKIEAKDGQSRERYITSERGTGYVFLEPLLPVEK
jgi:DNA-binding response OmpR family regulator